MSTSNSPIRYSLVDAPRWLSINSGDRRLHGTPRSDDAAEEHVVGIPIKLSGEDDEGSTIVDVALVISKTHPRR